MFEHENVKYCGGVSIDSKYLYVLVISDMVVYERFKAYVYKKDILYDTDNRLKAIDLGSAYSTINLNVNTF